MVYNSSNQVFRGRLGSYHVHTNVQLLGKEGGRCRTNRSNSGWWEGLRVFKSPIRARELKEVG